MCNYDTDWRDRPNDKRQILHYDADILPQR